MYKIYSIVSLTGIFVKSDYTSWETSSKSSLLSAFLTIVLSKRLDVVCYYFGSIIYISASLVNYCSKFNVLNINVFNQIKFVCFTSCEKMCWLIIALWRNILSCQNVCTGNFDNAVNLDEYWHTDYRSVKWNFWHTDYRKSQTEQTSNNFVVSF